MANIDGAFSTEILALDDTVLLTQGSADPTIGAGYEAPVGSLYLRTNGSVYRKVDTADVDWKIMDSVNAGSSVIIEDEGVTVTGGPFTNLNFIGEGVTAVDGGTGTVDITIDDNAFVQTMYGTIASQSGTSHIPYDNTVPLITEGTQMGAAPLTPTAATNYVTVEFTCVAGTSHRGADIVIAIFRDTTCIGVTTVTPSTGSQDGNANVSMKIVDTPNTTSQVTYSGRIGVTNGTWYLNDPIGTANFGGMVVAGSQFIITETKL